ncbi:MAG: hypothetical protein HY887_03845 [Deltaproteobacteria bacterium]|nr:hypothetical protein [Deltaproteobacteria bacterium]
METEGILSVFLERLRRGPDRAAYIGLTASFFLFALIIPVALWSRSSAKGLMAVKERAREFISLAVEFRAVKDRVDSLERKASISRPAGLAQAVHDISSSIGLNEKVKTVKSLGVRDVKDGMSSERAEVRLERLSMNELVNLFYKFEEAPMLVSIESVTIKKRFDSPEYLDVAMTVDLFSRK